MTRLSCFFEKVSDLGVGLILLFIGLLFAVISFAIVPVIGLLFAIPIIVLAVAFLFARRSRACALLADRTRNVLWT
ncbi:MAG: hypothetical protein JSW39_16795 [Desulfobacterales bacterium]|nr:MAG: hypothetical protein JSW39_16795 [Desulfobacterales bacterium]